MAGAALLLVGCGLASTDPVETPQPIHELVDAPENMETPARPVMATPPPERAVQSAPKNTSSADAERAEAHARHEAMPMRGLDGAADYYQEIDQSADEASDQEMAGVRETGFAPGDDEDDSAEQDPSDSDDEADDDEMAGVRETGFREGEDDMAGVRETGFLDAPDLRISAMDGTIALLEWTSLEEVQRYVITGEQYNYDSETSSQVRIEVSGIAYALETNGLRTLVRVRAVDEEGNALSKPSNTVEIPGT
jgi:hypothetical protein